MAIIVDTPAVETDLTILASVKNELGISVADDDDVLERFIDQASAFIRTYTGRLFQRETLTETLSGTGHIDLYLSRLPVVSITSVTLNAVVVPVAEYTLDKDTIGRVIRHDDGDPPAAKVWPLSSRPSSGLSQHIQYGSYANNLSIVYVAGYLLPGEVGRTLPEDIERAAMELTKWFFERRADDPSTRFEKIGDSAQALEINKQIPLTISMILDRWVQIPVPI